MRAIGVLVVATALLVGGSVASASASLRHCPERVSAPDNNGKRKALELRVRGIGCSDGARILHRFIDHRRATRGWSCHPGAAGPHQPSWYCIRPHGRPGTAALYRRGAYKSAPRTRRVLRPATKTERRGMQEELDRMFGIRRPNGMTRVRAAYVALATPRVGVACVSDGHGDPEFLLRLSNNRWTNTFAFNHFVRRSVLRAGVSRCHF